MNKEDVLSKHETYVRLSQPHNTTPIFLKDNVLLAMDEILLSFVNWHNENHPEYHIPNSRIGTFNLKK